jgi:hypothetical protein
VIVIGEGGCVNAFICYKQEIKKIEGRERERESTKGERGRRREGEGDRREEEGEGRGLLRSSRNNSY